MITETKQKTMVKESEKQELSKLTEEYKNQRIPEVQKIKEEKQQELSNIKEQNTILKQDVDAKEEEIQK